VPIEIEKKGASRRVEVQYRRSHAV
jgi:hypothetical protein